MVEGAAVAGQIGGTAEREGLGCLLVADHLQQAEIVLVDPLDLVFASRIETANGLVAGRRIGNELPVLQPMIVEADGVGTASTAATSRNAVSLSDWRMKACLPAPLEETLTSASPTARVIPSLVASLTL